jgi:hypothetical protein
MAFENLDFSKWTSGSARYAEGMKNSETTKGKAKSARMRGLESGIGTVLGAAVGGYFGGLGGAVSGAQIGGGLMSGDANSVASGISGLAGDSSSKPAYLRNSSSRQLSTYAVDPGQAASAMNMSGNGAAAMGILRGAAGGDTIDQLVAMSKFGGGLV